MYWASIIREINNPNLDPVQILLGLWCAKADSKVQRNTSTN